MNIYKVPNTIAEIKDKDKTSTEYNAVINSIVGLKNSVLAIRHTLGTLFNIMSDIADRTHKVITHLNITSELLRILLFNQINVLFL